MEQPDAEAAEVAQKAQKNPLNDLSRIVIACAIEVQKHLGTGLLESAYAAAMGMEFKARGLDFVREVPLTATYKGESVGIAYRADFVVERQLLVELKAVDSMLDVHRAQVLSYLRLGGLPLGMLINFHAFPVATEGITRVANQL